MRALRMIGRALFGKMPRPGEVYIFDDEPNPFKRDAFRVEVLEVKEGWVRYKHVGSTLWTNESMKADSFRFCYYKA